MIQRMLLLIAFLAAAVAMQAQSAGYLFFQVADPLDRNDLKFIMEEVLAVDPMAEVFISDDGSIIQFKGNAGEEAYRGALASAGVALLPGTIDPATLQAGGAADGPPVFLVTDDPAADLERYQAARAEWNAAHPDQPVGMPLHVTEQ